MSRRLEATLLWRLVTVTDLSRSDIQLPQLSLQVRVHLQLKEGLEQNKVNLSPME